MTYNEWIDQLKNHLLNVSEEERKKVLDYYSEAYADRRDHGYSEESIVYEFGAPYDAAKKILSNENEEYVANENVKQNRKKVEDNPSNQKNDNGILLALLIIILFIPTIVIVSTLFGLFVGLIAANIAIIASGLIEIAVSFVLLFTSDVPTAIMTFGGGLVLVGLGIGIAPWVYQLLKLVLQLFNKSFKWLKSKFVR